MDPRLTADRGSGLESNIDMLQKFQVMQKIAKQKSN